MSQGTLTQHDCSHDLYTVKYTLSEQCGYTSLYLPLAFVCHYINSQMFIASCHRRHVLWEATSTGTVHQQHPAVPGATESTRAGMLTTILTLLVRHSKNHLFPALLQDLQMDPCSVHHSRPGMVLLRVCRSAMLQWVSCIDTFQLKLLIRPKSFFQWRSRQMSNELSWSPYSTYSSSCSSGLTSRPSLHRSG